MTAGDKKPPRSRALRLVLWAVVQVVVVAVLLEVALRIAQPRHAGLNSLLYIPSVRTDFANIESTEDLLGLTTMGFSPGKEMAGFVANSRGFRTPEYSEARGEGVRIVALGDSFTYAPVPQSQSWPARLEAVLAATHPSAGSFEVISLGVPGVGPQFYLRMWELEGRRLRPDIVVLGFFVGNDLTEEGGRALHSESYAFVIQHSLVARAIRNSIRLIRSGGVQGQVHPDALTDGSSRTGATGIELEDWTRAFDPEKPTLWEPTYYEIETERMAVCLRRNTAHLQMRLQMVQPVLRELQQSVQSTGAELVILLIPDEYQIDDELSAMLLERLDLTTEDYDLRMPQDALISFFESEGIHVVDVLPEFRIRAENETLYLFRDTHWNAAGNQLAAEQVATFLSEMFPGLN